MCVRRRTHHSPAASPAAAASNKSVDMHQVLLAQHVPHPQYTMVINSRAGDADEGCGVCFLCCCVVFKADGLLMCEVYYGTNERGGRAVRLTHTQKKQ